MFMTCLWTMTEGLGNAVMPTSDSLAYSMHMQSIIDRQAAVMHECMNPPTMYQIQQNLANVLDDVAQDLAPYMDEITAATAPYLDNIAMGENPAMFYDEIFGELAPHMDEITAALAPHLDEIGAAFHPILSPGQQALVPYLDDIAADLAPYMDEITAAMAPYLDNIAMGENPAMFYDEIFGELAPHMDEITAAIAPYMDEIAMAGGLPPPFPPFDGHPCTPPYPICPEDFYEQDYSYVTDVYNPPFPICPDYPDQPIYSYDADYTYPLRGEGGFDGVRGPSMNADCYHDSVSLSNNWDMPYDPFEGVSSATMQSWTTHFGEYQSFYADHGFSAYSCSYTDTAHLSSFDSYGWSTSEGAWDGLYGRGGFSSSGCVDLTPADICSQAA
jgi:hypothetical protein